MRDKWAQSIKDDILSQNFADSHCVWFLLLGIVLLVLFRIIWLSWIPCIFRRVRCAEQTALNLAAKIASKTLE